MAVVVAVAEEVGKGKFQYITCKSSNEETRVRQSHQVLRSASFCILSGNFCFNNILYHLPGQRNRAIIRMVDVSYFTGDNWLVVVHDEATLCAHFAKPHRDFRIAFEVFSINRQKTGAY